MLGQVIRLACSECDRDDFDMIETLPDWECIQEVQSYEEATKTYDNPEDEPEGFCVLDWYTHIGLCPECS